MPVPQKESSKHWTYSDCPPPLPCHQQNCTIAHCPTKNDPETKLDLGGVGKGYAAERLIEHLSETNIPYGLISLGGNIGVFGNKTTGERYKVGLTDPNNPSDVIGYLYISEGFLSVN